MTFYTDAGKNFSKNMTEWLQNTRLMSEASFRLSDQHKQSGPISFSASSWPRKAPGGIQYPKFEMSDGNIDQRMNGLLKSVWRSQFIFLETFWEEYLQELVLELRGWDVSIFEPFCEKDFMAEIVKDVLSGKLENIDDIKDEVASRFAAGITRKPWEGQWGQLARLNIGLSAKDKSESWFSEMDVYFEMRNCIIHRKGRVSAILRQKSDYYSKNKIDILDIWPQNLDFCRKIFLDCVLYIEGKIKAKKEGSRPSV